MTHPIESDHHPWAVFTRSIDKFVERYDGEDISAGMCRFCDDWPTHSSSCPLPPLKRAQRRLHALLTKGAIG